MSGETKLSPYVPELGFLQAGWQIYVLQEGWQVSILQVWWQVSLSAQVSFVRAMALVCRLLAVTTSSGLSPARVVTSFFLLVVLGVSFCRWWPVFL
jgi:hypothetical protein